jgi:Undecaprenyl-phosphate glucose phosphotransferase
LLKALKLLQGCVLGTLLFIAFTYFYEEYRYSRLTLFFFAFLHPIMVLSGRVITQALQKIYFRHAKKHSVLFIARGQGLPSVLETFLKSLEGTSQVFGVILPGTDDKQQDIDFCNRHGLNILSSPESWSQFFTEHDINSVFINLPYSQYEYLDENLDAIADQVANVKIIPDILRYTRFTAGIEVIGSTPVINVHESPLSGLNTLFKRLFDITGSIIALLIFAPIMLLISLLVPLSSPGPILYRQERMGLDGKKFKCLKFRSMPIDSESNTGAVWATPDDNRATKFGSLLRRTSLDELPQLLNVLRGDMSLVGPRPERPVFVNEFRTKVPGYMLRHKVKTGITGWAQVNGWRGSTSIHKRIECDLYYIQNWSLWLDIKILLMTIEEVFFSRNAY